MEGGSGGVMRELLVTNWSPSTPSPHLPPSTSAPALLKLSGADFGDVKEGDVLRLKDCRVKAGVNSSLVIEGNEKSAVVLARGAMPSSQFRAYERVVDINANRAKTSLEVNGKRLVDFSGVVDRTTNEGPCTVFYVRDSAALIKVSRYQGSTHTLTVGATYRFRDVTLEGYDEFFGCSEAVLGYQAVVERYVEAATAKRKRA
jgi:hypothetical protein